MDNSLKEAWKDYSNLLWWWANKLAKAFGGPASKYIGFLTIKLAKALKYYRPELGAFSTYFSRKTYTEAMYAVVRPESEWASVRYHKLHSQNKISPSACTAAAKLR